MGWTFMRSRGKDRITIIRELLDYDTDTYTQEIIDHAAVGTTVYLLVKRTPKGTWEPNSTYINDTDGSFRWIAVFLTRYARDACDFGYKDMEESMGPNESRCPLRLITRASSLRNADPAVEGHYAARWRARCQNFRDQQTRKAKLENGTVLRFASPITFADGYQGDVFTVAITQRRGRNFTYFRASHGGLYRINNLQAMDYQIETAPAAASQPAMKDKP